MKKIIYIVFALLTCLVCAVGVCACAPAEPTGEVTLSLSANNATIGIDEQTTFSATTKVGETVVGSTYTWSVSKGDATAVELTSNGGEVTVKGKKFGKVTLACKSAYKGKNYIETVEVDVRNGAVVFTVNNLTNNSIALHTQADPLKDYISSFKPDITVTENGTAVDVGQITWSVENQNVASVFAGTISAVDKGETRVLAYYNGNGVYFDVSVEYARYELAEKVYIEYAENDTFPVGSKFAGDVYDVTYKGESIFKSYNRNTGKVALASDNLKMGNLDEKITVYAGMSIYDVSAEYIAMFVSDAKEFIKMQDVAYELGDKHPDTPTLEGIFYLDSDIKFTIADIYRMNYQRGDWEGGFRGILDGRGHVVDGLRILNKESIFHSLRNPDGGKGGIYNISFINSVKEGEGGFISDLRDGELKNVYIHFKEVVCGKQTFAVSRENHWSSWNLVNVMTVTDKLTAMDGVLNPQFFALGIVRHKYYKPSLTQYCSVVNCAAVCSPANGVTVNGWMEQPDSSSEWTTTDATPTLDDLNEVQSKWDSSFWTVTDGVPAPKNLVD